MNNLIPDFLKPFGIRTYCTLTALDKVARVGGMLVSSYVAKCNRENNPIKYKTHHGGRVYRMLDVIARARAEGFSIGPNREREMRKSILELTMERDRLAQVVSDGKHKLGLDTASARLTNKTLLSEDEIVKGRIKAPQVCGVYFLIKGNKVVYVGQSVSVFNRVAQHVGSKDFDDFSFIPCLPDVLDKLESLYIHVLKPPLNAKLANGRVDAPMPLDVLMAMAL